MKITVVIVSYNVKFYLQQCLDSLLRALQGIESEVFVVDNHSKDGSVDYLSKRFPGVNVIDSPHNLGFARANNLAIRKSHAEYVLLLNPDTVVGESTIRTAIDFMDAHEDAGSLGVRMLDASGKAALESRRGLPSPMVAFYKMVGLCARFPNSHRFGQKQKRGGTYTVGTVFVFANGGRAPPGSTINGAILVLSDFARMQTSTRVNRTVFVLTDGIRV